MSDDDYYQRQADEAQKQADRSISDVNRSSWLRIAQSWLGLIKGRANTATEDFDDAAKDRGTNQNVSKGSQ